MLLFTIRSSFLCIKRFVLLLTFLRGLVNGKHVHCCCFFIHKIFKYNEYVYRSHVAYIIICSFAIYHLSVSMQRLQHDWKLSKKQPIRLIKYCFLWVKKNLFIVRYSAFCYFVEMTWCLKCYLMNVCNFKTSQPTTRCFSKYHLNDQFIIINGHFVCNIF